MTQDSERNRVRTLVDAALRKNGDLREYGDLSVGLSVIELENHVRISVQSTGYHVDIAPQSGQGHDVSFRVDPNTLELHDVTVGQLEPEPE